MNPNRGTIVTDPRPTKSLHGQQGCNHSTHPWLLLWARWIAWCHWLVGTFWYWLAILSIAGIRPDRPINRQQKDHCIYIRTWNPKTKKISNEGIDPWWYEYPYLYSSQRHHSPPSIKIFFGHQRHDKARVSDWACALDGSIVFGATLWAYVKNKWVLEINAKRAYELEWEKDLHHLQLHFDPLPKELYKVMIKIITECWRCGSKDSFAIKYGL